MSGKPSNKNGNSKNQSPSPPPPAPGRVNSGKSRRRSGGRQRERGYALPREKSHRSSQLTILLCVFDSASSGWRTKSITVDKYRANDQELWSAIRSSFRDELEKPWRRILLFKRLKHIVPITYTRNDIPIRTDPKDYPDAHEFMHCYHHPDRTRTNHQWIDWFDNFEKDADKSYGLEFIEGLWAEKLVALAVLVTIAVIVVSVVWCVRGGNLQTVFTVMSFVLGGATAEVALVALYYQVSLPG